MDRIGKEGTPDSERKAGFQVPEGYFETLSERIAQRLPEHARECLVFEVCQPHQAKKVLDQDMSVSTARPSGLRMCHR